MTRRDFLQSGVGGMGVALAGGTASAGGIPAAGRSAPSAQAADANFVVVGADGSVTSKPIVDKYVAAAAEGQWARAETLAQQTDYRPTNYSRRWPDVQCSRHWPSNNP
jgi:hypothetical protein